MQENCAHGFVRSCSKAAAIFAPVLVRHPDCRRAEPVARKACDGKDDDEDDDACAIADACALAGPAPDAALDRLRLACGRGVALGCLYWADAQPAGTDAERVDRAYAIACRGRSVAAEVACPRFAASALGRATLSVDAERPLATLRDACERESGEACCALAGEYERGKWVPSDETKASELRAKACTLGHERCCRSMATPARP